MRTGERRPRTAALTTGGAVIALLTLGLAAPAHADDTPPTTHPDAVTVMAGSVEHAVDLVANDEDPDGVIVGYCGTDVTPPDGIHVIGDGQDPDVVDVSAEPDSVPGVYPLTAYVCDSSTLYAETLTVTVVASLGDQVTVRHTDVPGESVVSNRNATPIRLIWGSNREDRPDGSVKVPAGGTALIPVQRRAIVWIATTSTEYAADTSRHLSPDPTQPVLPAVKPGLDYFSIISSPWAQKAIKRVESH